MDHSHHNLMTSTIESMIKSKIEATKENHNLHDGMVMSFHGGYSETILFDFWNTSTVPSTQLFLITNMAIIDQGP